MQRKRQRLVPHDYGADKIIDTHKDAHTVEIKIALDGYGIWQMVPRLALTP